MHGPPTNEHALFAAPQLTRATVPILAIEEPQLGGARSLTRNSLETFGQLTDPIVQDLHPMGEAPVGGVRYRIIDGHRRIHDLREMNPHAVIQVRILPFEVGAASASAIAISLNYHRTYNPLAEAQHFDTLRREGMTVDQIAKNLGIPRGKIDRRLLLIDKLHPLLRALVETNEAAVTVAERCARLSFDRQQLIALDVLTPDGAKKLTHALVSQHLRAIRQQGLPPAALFTARVDQAFELRDAVRLVAEDRRANSDHSVLQALVDGYPEFFAEEEAPDDRT